MKELALPGDLSFSTLRTINVALCTLRCYAKVVHFGQKRSSRKS